MQPPSTVHQSEEDEDKVEAGHATVHLGAGSTFEHVWIRLSAAVHQAKSAPITKSPGQQLNESKVGDFQFASIATCTFTQRIICKLN